MPGLSLTWLKHFLRYFKLSVGPQTLNWQLLLARYYTTHFIGRIQICEKSLRWWKTCETNAVNLTQTTLPHTQNCLLYRGEYLGHTDTPKSTTPQGNSHLRHSLNKTPSLHLPTHCQKATLTHSMYTQNPQNQVYSLCNSGRGEWEGCRYVANMRRNIQTLKTQNTGWVLSRWLKSQWAPL